MTYPLKTKKNQNFILLLISPIFFKKERSISKIFAQSPKSTTWQITEEFTGCGNYYDDENFIEDENSSTAIFKEGDWFNNVWDKGKMANCGSEDYEKVQEVAESCGAKAIIEVG